MKPRDSTSGVPRGPQDCRVDQALHDHIVLLAGAIDIARHLSDVWQAGYEESTDHARLRRRDGLEISIDTVRYYEQAAHSAKGRLVLRGLYPVIEGRTYGPGRKYEITCAADKTPKQLAVEIERRILGAGFEQAWREASDYAIRASLHREHAKATANKIAHLLDVDEVHEAKIGDAIAIAAPTDKVWRIKVQPASGMVEDAGEVPRVSFDVHGLDEATALRVLEILKENGGG